MEIYLWLGLVCEKPRSPSNVSLDEFRRTVYNVISQDEPLAARFAKLSASSDRRGMIGILEEMPYVADLKLSDSYEGKNDAQAARLYERSLEATMKLGDEHMEIKTCNILTQALFAASANSRVFLDAIYERARRFYSLRVYASCLRYCDCMLALPVSFYDDSTENIKYFVQRRKECLQLERECSRKLEATSSRKRGARGRTSSISSVTSSSSFRSSSSSVLPIVDGKPHSYLTSCPESVELRFDEARGRHLVATRDIKPGAVLIVDQPFSFSTDAPALGRNCLHCHATLKLEDSVRIPCRNCQTVSFCTEACRREAWEKYHRYECSVFNYFFKKSSNNECQTSYLLLAYRTTVIQALQNSVETTCVLNLDFLRYHANNNAKDKDDDDISKECADLGSKITYSPLDYRTVFQLETHCADVESNVNLIRTIEAIFLTKCLIFILSKLDVICTKETFISLAAAMLHHLQAINCNAYEIIENVHDEATRVWDPRNIGAAIYTTVSLVNHCCYPNVIRHSYPNGIVVVRALRFIGKGSEILDCYGPHFLSDSKLNRREFLWKKYRFLCECDACKQNWKSPLPETTSYKCATCSESVDPSIVNARMTYRCAKCEKMIDLKRIEKQLCKSIQKRLSAIAKMYQGNYKDALPLLFEHADFVNKHLTEPNIEGIKTEQCIVQCYNSLGSISV